ncbi:transposase [bacterium]|nr:transposase [bacterium]
MGSDSKGTRPGEAFGRDSIEQVMRERIRETIEVLVEEELEAALGAAKSARVGGERVGYRHGRRPRTLSTSLGLTTFALPRAWLHDAAGEEREWRSARCSSATQAHGGSTRLLGIYLSGTNTRRLRGALAPLLRGAPLGKDAISRLVGRLREDFTTWSQRDLAAEQIRYLFLDGWYPRVRIGKKGTGPGAGDAGDATGGGCCSICAWRARRARPPEVLEALHRSASWDARCWR